MLPQGHRGISDGKPEITGPDRGKFPEECDGTAEESIIDLRPPTGKREAFRGGSRTKWNPFRGGSTGKVRGRERATDSSTVNSLTDQRSNRSASSVVSRATWHGTDTTTSYASILLDNGTTFLERNSGRLLAVEGIVNFSYCYQVFIARLLSRINSDSIECNNE